MTSPTPSRSLEISEARRRDPYGRYMVWLCAGALAFNLLMVVGIISLLSYNGFSAFWPPPLVLFELEDGSRVLGEIHERELLPPVYSDEAVDETASETPRGHRLRVKVANKDLTGSDFMWLNESDIRSRSFPAGAVLLERTEYGDFYGWPVELDKGGEKVAGDSEEFWSAFSQLHEGKLELLGEMRDLEKGPLDDVNFVLKKLEIERRGIEKAKLPEAEEKALLADVDARIEEFRLEYEVHAKKLFALRDQAEVDHLLMEAVDGTRKEILVSSIVRAVPANDMDRGERWGLYFSRLWEFVSDYPREANMEGGIFPAIFGTVMMVFLMTLFVVPLGVLAALYLREYARDGLAVRIVRIAVNNLAGVPSIVFGVFGLGFFVYLCGGAIDNFFYSDALPTPTFGTGGILWASLTLALLTLPVVIVATEEGLAAVPNSLRAGSLALGATKFETIRRVVLPSAFPGVLTGTILAMARAAGEVAPLMIVGMVKLAPAMPVDSHPPFLHLDRKFMHLGFHIYDVGFQSPDSEAGVPVVFATSLLLVILVVIMNLVAISVRNHLRTKYASSAV